MGCKWGRSNGIRRSLRHFRPPRACAPPRRIRCRPPSPHDGGCAGPGIAEIDQYQAPGTPKRMAMSEIRSPMPENSATETNRSSSDLLADLWASALSEETDGV